MDPLLQINLRQLQIRDQILLPQNIRELLVRMMTMLRRLKLTRRLNSALLWSWARPGDSVNTFTLSLDNVKGVPGPTSVILGSANKKVTLYKPSNDSVETTLHFTLTIVYSGKTAFKIFTLLLTLVKLKIETCVELKML